MPPIVLGRIRDLTLVKKGYHLEEGGVAVGYIVMQLVAFGDHEVWILDAENRTKKVNCQRIGLARRQRLPVGINRVFVVFAHAESSHHVRVGDLKNL